MSTYTVVLHVHVEAESHEEAIRMAMQSVAFDEDVDVSIEGCDSVEDIHEKLAAAAEDDGFDLDEVDYITTETLP